MIKLKYKIFILVYMVQTYYFILDNLRKYINEKVL